VGTLGHAARKIIVLWSAKAAESARVKFGEIIADNLSAAGWSWGCVATLNSNGQTIFVADAHRDDGRRFIVHADERLSAFDELERQVFDRDVLSGIRSWRFVPVTNDTN
jgi:hypothetical protein